MSERLEKADFYLETEEYDKAEDLYSELFEEDSENEDAIIGIIITKIYQSDFEKNQFKAAQAYLNKIDTVKLTSEQREHLVNGILDATDHYIDRVLTKFREHAHELSKRPALDGQLYNIKQLGDTTDYMGYINDNIEKFTDGLDFSAKVYDIAKDKDETAFKILSLYDKIFQNLRETPQMQGKTLLDSKDLTPLKERRKEWLDKSGEHKSKVQTDPSDSSGCLVLIATLSGLAAASVSILVFFL